MNTNDNDNNNDANNDIDIGTPLPMPELKTKRYIKKTIEDIQNEYITLNKLHQPSFNDQTISTLNTSLPSSSSNPIHHHQHSDSQSQMLSFDIQSPSTNNDNKPTSSYFYRKIGNVHTFIADSQGNPFFIIGPQWPMFVFLTFLVNGIICSFLYLFWEIYSSTFKTIGIILLTLFQLSYTYTFVINPGYPRNDNDRQLGEPREDFSYCAECKFFVAFDRKVNHCYDCGICVEGYDHHCPWTSKCIGRKNLWSFYMFMVSIMLIFGYFICSLTTAEK